MKAFLMYKDRDFDQQQPLPVNEAALGQDLDLNVLFNAMALNDKFLFDIIKKTIFYGLNDLETMYYRQNILKDCLKNPLIIREIYQITIEVLNNKRKRWMGIFTGYPNGILRESIEMIDMYVLMLRKLRAIADEHSEKFESEGFTKFFTMIKKELDEEYFEIVQNHLKQLRFRDGILVSAELGKGNEGTNYILRKPNVKNKNWVKWVFTRMNPAFTFYIADRDDAGARALSNLKDRGVNSVANALAQSADHIDSFFKMMQIELAFYFGWLNLYEKLTEMGSPIAFPTPALSNERKFSFRGLYDICLALTMKKHVIGNDLNADDKDLFIITGANQGGKSTFLRSVGLAQLMMQCGMFVAAEDYSANLCTNLFTHYKRKEDASMKSGKLDEELNRMNDIVNHISPNSMVLFKESIAATNEREGSEIARQITEALVEKRVKIFFVTHMYEFAHKYYEKKMENSIFLRAERKAGGGRSYKLFEGEPLQTSYGKDLYDKIFRIENKPAN
jgi:DNA mismatch repair ATPase MutS